MNTGCQITCVGMQCFALPLNQRIYDFDFYTILTTQVSKGVQSCSAHYCKYLISQSHGSSSLHLGTYIWSRQLVEEKLFKSLMIVGATLLV